MPQPTEIVDEDAEKSGEELEELEEPEIEEHVDRVFADLPVTTQLCYHHDV
jgi:hypothetical protein